MESFKQLFNALLDQRLKELSKESLELNGDERREEIEEEIEKLAEEFVSIANDVASPDEFQEIQDAYHAWEDKQGELDDADLPLQRLSQAINLLKFPESEGGEIPALKRTPSKKKSKKK